MAQLNVSTTSNLDKFQFHDLNRDINRNHVTRLADSIRKRGIRQPIVVDTHGYVIDGQHRVLAARRLKAEGEKVKVPYITKQYTPDIIAEMNSLQLSWTTRDWVHYHAKCGNEQYTQLLEIYSVFNKTKLSSLASFLHPGYVQLHTSEIKNGNFVYELTDDKLYILEQTEELVKFDKGFGTKAFLMAVMVLCRMDNFNPRRLFDKLSGNLSSVRVQSGISNWAHHLVYWYNKGKRDGRLSTDDLPRSH